eukprot:11348420-Alexandrium_andersonii.AAC.1
MAQEAEQPSLPARGGPARHHPAPPVHRRGHPLAPMGGGGQALQGAAGPVDLAGGEPRSEPARRSQTCPGVRSRLAPQLRRGRSLLPGRQRPRLDQAGLRDQGI